METTDILFTGRGYCEYKLAIVPASEVYERVMAEKAFFSDEFGHDAPSETKPLITIASFYAKEAMESIFMRWMQAIFSKKQPFPVTFNNFSGIPAHTIYLRVQHKEPFEQLSKELLAVNNYLCSCQFPAVKFFHRPYLGIAKMLPEEIFFKALIQYSKKTFTASFLVNELLLIKKEHSHEAGKTINVFALQPATHESQYSIPHN
jgi:hypothetical protein